jgi:hypothetical protein
MRNIAAPTSIIIHWHRREAVLAQFISGKHAQPQDGDANCDRHPLRDCAVREFGYRRHGLVRPSSRIWGSVTGCNSCRASVAPRPK